MIHQNHNLNVVIGGVIFLGLVIAIFFFGRTDKEKAITDFSDSTIAPLADPTFTPGPCVCPTPEMPLSKGAIGGAAHIGQMTHEGNSPYSFNDCKSNAAEMFQFLQDQEIFQYAQSITRGSLGTYPPKQLYYTWDQKAGQCNFYFQCGGMTKCSDESVASGLIM